jgi:putative membrane protein
MRVLADVLAALVALEHAGFLVLEMFLWTKPIGLRIFRLTPQAAELSAKLAINQGLYNGFLAAGLIWGLCAADAAAALSIKTFFLVCVAVAGAFGGATVGPSVFFVQAAPALAALALLRLAR